MNRLKRFLYLLRTFRDYEDRLKRSVSVENVLGAVAEGKRAPLTPDECRELSAKLGVPSYFQTRKTKNEHWREQWQEYWGSLR